MEITIPGCTRCHRLRPHQGCHQIRHLSHRTQGHYQGPAGKNIPLINDLTQWPQWSPWEKLDPNVKRSPSGPASGVGAVYAWEGNNKVGSGRMEITESISSSKVVMKLDFFKPFEAHNTAEFTLETKGDSTEIT